MIIFIQQPTTKRFYRKDETWTDRREEAQMFGSLVSAMAKCSVKKLCADIVVGFGGSAHSLKFPCGSR